MPVVLTIGDLYIKKNHPSIIKMRAGLRHIEFFYIYLLDNFHTYLITHSVLNGKQY